jgi:predicted 2-oxoglutarate/Fe(II)-dependent dioxygenase YbiX
MQQLKLDKYSVAVPPVLAVEGAFQPQQLNPKTYIEKGFDRKKFTGGIYTDSKLEVFSVPPFEVPEIVLNAIEDYGKLLGYKKDALYIIANPQISIYRKGYSRSWHIDGGFPDPKDPHKTDSFNHCLFTCVVELDSEYTGGQLEFFAYHEEFNKLPQSKGVIRFFPSVVWHKVNPVTKGVRYSLSLFIGLHKPIYCMY